MDGIYETMQSVPAALTAKDIHMYVQTFAVGFIEYLRGMWLYMWMCVFVVCVCGCETPALRPVIHRCAAEQACGLPPDAHVRHHHSVPRYLQ